MCESGEVIGYSSPESDVFLPDRENLQDKDQAWWTGTVVMQCSTRIGEFSAQIRPNKFDSEIHNAAMIQGRSESATGRSVVQQLAI